MTPELWRLFVRSRGGLARTSALGGAVAVVVLVVPVDLLAVPLRDGVNATVFPNAVLLAGALVTLVLASPWRDLEEVVPGRRLVVLRAAWFAGVSAWLVLAGTTVVGVRGLDPSYSVDLTRSALLAVGVGAASACVLPRSSAWVPVTTYAMVSWLWGTSDAEGTARLWALPNQPLGSTGAAVAAGGLWLLGAVVYAWRDGRQAD